MSFIVQPVQAPSIFKVQSTETGGAAGKINFDVSNYDILYYEGDASGDFTLNVRGESGVTLTSLMNIGDVVDISLQVTNGATNKSLQYLEIDDGASEVNISLPSGQTTFQSFASAITVYDFSIERSSTGAYFVETQVTRQELTISSPTGVTFTNVSASLLSNSINVAFTPTGGTSASVYVAVSNPVGIVGFSSASPINILNLRSGTYEFAVSTYNPAGIGSLSSASNSITIDVPDAPTIGTASATNSSAISVSFTPGASGWTGANVTYYAVSNPGGFVATGSASPITVNAPYSGTYAFNVYAENAAGTSQLSSASNTITIEQVNVDYLVIGGGGGGGYNRGLSDGGGGGGAGGYRFGSGTIYTGLNYTISIGAGGAGAVYATGVTQASASPGTLSIFDVIQSAGGGAGTVNLNAGPGGSGGGAGGGSALRLGGTGNVPVVSPSQGNNGGNCAPSGAYNGGGGGAGSAGVSGSSSNPASGSGGAGLSSSITGVSVGRAGGGAGSGVIDGTATDGGGNTDTDGTVNTGGGGGGIKITSGPINGKAGGSGIVILRYPIANGVLTSIGAGLTYSLSTVGTDYVYQFTQGTDSIKWG